MVTETHHDLCTTCAKIPTEHTPKGFPLPGDIAELHTQEGEMSYIKLHRVIAQEIAERDRLWCEKYEELCAQAVENALSMLP